MRARGQDELGLRPVHDNSARGGRVRRPAASKEAAANGYECVLGAVVLVQIESAAAERMAGTHYGDIVRVKQRSRSG